MTAAARHTRRHRLFATDEFGAAGGEEADCPGYGLYSPGPSTVAQPGRVRTIRPPTSAPYKG
jgi:hypothetical protein